MINLQDYKGRRAAISALPEPTTRDELIVKYLPLVYYIVNSLTFSLPPMLDTDDLVGYGAMGLIDAIDRFDAQRGVKFETYAVTRVRGFIIDQLRSLDWVPRSARQRARQIERARDEMEHALGRTPTADEVARHVGLERDKYDRALKDAACVTLSLDVMTRPDDDDAVAALLEVVQDDSSPDPGAVMDAHDLETTVSTAIGTLSEREQHLLRLYYFEERTLQEISRVLHVSESRACQIHSQALKRLRSAIAA